MPQRVDFNIDEEDHLPKSLGRNGLVKTSGIMIQPLGYATRIVPITSKGEMASGFVAVSDHAIPSLITALAEAYLHAEQNGMEDLLAAIEEARRVLPTAPDEDVEAIMAGPGR